MEVLHGQRRMKRPVKTKKNEEVRSNIYDYYIAVAHKHAHTQVHARVHPHTK